MSLILHIDTAQESGYVSLALEGRVIAERYSTGTRENASFLHTAIASLFTEQNIAPAAIQAVAVSAGPGSYTGLRIGMSAAKGICYALQKPLICINTLELMAADALAQIRQSGAITSFFICPMIDARRMEVFTAVYDQCLNIESAPCAALVEPAFLDSYLSHVPVYFTGSGSVKWEKMSKSTRAVFLPNTYNFEIINELAYEYFIHSRFEPLQYVEPFYCKDFYSSTRE